MKTIGCDISLEQVELKCTYMPRRSLKDFSASFNFKPLELGTITIGSLRPDDDILINGHSIIVKYKDGTKWTINKSWFE